MEKKLIILPKYPFFPRKQRTYGINAGKVLALKIEYILDSFSLLLE